MIPLSLIILLHTMILNFSKVLLLVFLSKVNGAENLNLIKPFVVNGTDTEIEAFAFMVSLRLRGSHLCGGTILNELWILTASHCLAASSNASDFSVQYASTVIANVSPRVMTAEHIIKHEKFSPSKQYMNDIGLVKLKAPLNITLKGFRVKLPVLGSFFETGTPAMLSGWGASSTEGALMKTLQKVDLQVYSSTDCAKLHEKIIHNSNICGGVPGGYKSQCLGDSGNLRSSLALRDVLRLSFAGGPLLVNDVQVGIVSWSIKPCGVPPYPGVFTAVSHYIDWIEHHTGIDFRLNMFLLSPA